MLKQQKDIFNPLRLQRTETYILHRTGKSFISSHNSYVVILLLLLLRVEFCVPPYSQNIDWGCLKLKCSESLD